MIYLELFLAFVEVGCFSFGGAYGAIPLIRDAVLSHSWLDEEALSNMIAVSESTPGPIMVNMATYVGSTQAGFLGALIATTAVILPSFFVILLVTVLLRNALKSNLVQAVLRGLKPCVIGIVLATGICMILQICLGSGLSFKVNYPAIAIGLLLVLVKTCYRRLSKKSLSPILLILLSAAAGIVIYGLL